MRADALYAEAYAEVDAYMRAHFLIVPVAIGLVRSSSLELMTGDRTDSIRSMIEKIPPKGLSFSDFIAIFATSSEIFRSLALQHKDK